MSAPIKEQVIQEEALEAPNKDFPEDDASGNFAALPAENADTEKEIEKKERGNPDALFLEVKVSKMQGIAPPAPVLSMPIRPLRTTTIKEKDVNDNFARAVFEECFGSLTVPVLSVTEKLALRELCGVDLRQGLCLDAFQSGVGPCSMTNHVLAKVLRLSDNRVGRYRQQAHESQEQENGKRHPMRGEEEEEEEKENAKSIVWAISSLAPSRFNSVSQGQVMDFEVAREKRANRLEKGVKRNDVEGPGGDDEEKGGGEVDDGGQEAVDESFGRGLVLSEGTTNSAMEVTQALSVSSPSLSSQLDNNIFFGGVGGCGEGERRWMSNLKQSQQADKFPVDNVMSHAFIRIGLDPPGDEATKSSMVYPDPMNLLTSATSKANFEPNKAPLSGEAQAVIFGAVIPDFSYMLAKVPVVPQQDSAPSTSTQLQNSRKNNLAV
ncbi:Hypothetical protein NocV09_02700150 [Nannochloropsis oceanica]